MPYKSSTLINLNGNNNKQNPKHTDPCRYAGHKPIRIERSIAEIALRALCNGHPEIGVHVLIATVILQAAVSLDSFVVTWSCHHLEYTGNIG